MTGAHFAPAASRAAAGLEVAGLEVEAGLHLFATEPTNVSYTGCSVPVLTTFGKK